MKQQPIGSFVLVTKNNKILLGKRKNAYKKGSYGCPGGRLLLKESLLDCARRELYEEAGVRAINLKYVGVIRELQEGYNFVHFVFRCSRYKGKISIKEPNKCEKWKFHSIDCLPLNILPAHRRGIEMIGKDGINYVDLYG